MIRRWLPVLTLVLLLLFAVQWRRAPQREATSAANYEASVPPKGGFGGFTALAAMEEEYTRLVESVVPAVVSITTQKRVRQQISSPFDAFEWLFGAQQRVVKATGLGSGVIVSPEGHVITNHHVISGMEEIQVQLTDGRTQPAQLIGSDPATDIAVLKIQGPVPALGFADSDQVRVGQPVLAVGNPFGLQETVTQGIISAKGRAVRDSGVEFLQTDAAVNQGNSGGPLLNFRGEVIGINSAIYSANTGTWLGISFAIPSNVAKRSMESLLRTGKVQRLTLGVATMPITPELARQVGLRAVVGAWVTQVWSGSPADRGGIRPGDVIVRINGELVENPAALQRFLADKKVGTRVQVNVVRDGREYTVAMEVAEQG